MALRIRAEKVTPNPIIGIQPSHLLKTPFHRSLIPLLLLVMTLFLQGDWDEILFVHAFVACV